MSSDGNNPKYPVQTLEKALDIIEILTKESGNGLGISDLSRRLDIGKSTIHRILDTLSAYGYVDQISDKGNYRLSWRLYEIGNVVPQQRDLSNLDGEILQDLCDRCRETVNLGVRNDNYVVIVSKVEPANSALIAIKHVGDREPLHATALGKILLSGLDTGRVEAIFAPEDRPLVSYTQNTITSFGKLHLELQKVREQGYAVDNEEFNAGMSCIAMPVRNYENQVVAAISVSGPSFRLNFSKIMEIRADLAVAGRKMSEFLGHNTVGQKTETRKTTTNRRERRAAVYQG